MRGRVGREASRILGLIFFILSFLLHEIIVNNSSYLSGVVLGIKRENPWRILTTVPGT